MSVCSTRPLVLVHSPLRRKYRRLLKLYSTIVLFERYCLRFLPRASKDCFDSRQTGNLLAEEVANRSSMDGYSPPNVHNGYGSRPSSMIGTPPTTNRTSADGYSSSGLEDSPPAYVAPPLPSQPPPKPRRPEDSDSDIAGTLSDGDQEWRRGYSKNRGEDKVQYRETYHPRGDTPSGATVARHASLPGSGNPPANLAGNLQQYSATLDHRHQRVPSSEGSSEGDYGDKKSRDRKKGVLSLFRKR